jgi:8-oxo-dGTP pyrophosphatase MutT (NUDIX family)
MMTDQSNPWTTLSSQRFYESRYVDVDQDEVRHRSGKIHPYTALRFRIYGIAVLPIFDDGSTYLIGQYRYLSQRYTWELPRGSGSKSVDPRETGQRELKEETGATAGQWLEVLHLMVSPGITDEMAPCFVAWDLEQGHAHPDPQEDLTIRRLPFREVVNAALDGSICDAVSVATILAVHTRATQENLPDDLMGRLR